MRNEMIESIARFFTWCFDNYLGGLLFIVLGIVQTKIAMKPKKNSWDYTGKFWITGPLFILGGILIILSILLNWNW